VVGFTHKSQNTSLDSLPSSLIVSTSGGHVPTTMKKQMTAMKQKESPLIPGIEMNSNIKKKQ